MVTWQACLHWLSLTQAPRFCRLLQKGLAAETSLDEDRLAGRSSGHRGCLETWSRRNHVLEARQLGGCLLIPQLCSSVGRYGLHLSQIALLSLGSQLKMNAASLVSCPASYGSMNMFCLTGHRGGGTRPGLRTLQQAEHSNFGGWNKMWTPSSKEVQPLAEILTQNIKTETSAQCSGFSFVFTSTDTWLNKHHVW